MVGLSAGYFISRSAIDFLKINYTEKDLTELSKLRRAPDAEPTALPIRMVDLGGVGVVPDSIDWGDNYEHNQRFFEEVMLVGPPFVDEEALALERE